MATFQEFQGKKRRKKNIGQTHIGRSEYFDEMKKNTDFKPQQIDRIIEMAWEDRTPFDAIKLQFGIKEEEVIRLMRSEMKSSSFKMWRARVQGRKTKHLKQRGNEVDRFKCTRQRGISNNKVSKR